MRTDSIVNDFEQSLRRGRLAHAYVIVAHPRLTGIPLTESLLELVFQFDDSVDARGSSFNALCHADILWAEPTKKSRVIAVEQIREMNKRIAQTSYGGGWKAGVLVAADCMNAAAANAFLKTLEEPPPQSILFLLTDAPSALLPTILSRCQIIYAREDRALYRGTTWFPSLMEVLREGLPQNPIHAMEIASRLSGILNDVMLEIKNEMPMPEYIDNEEEKKKYEARVQSRLLEERRAFLQVMQLWYRDIFCSILNEETNLHFEEERASVEKTARGLPIAAALHMAEHIQEIDVYLAGNIKETTVFDYALLNIGIEGRKSRV